MLSCPFISVLWSCTGLASVAQAVRVVRSSVGMPSVRGRVVLMAVYLLLLRYKARVRALADHLEHVGRCSLDIAHGDLASARQLNDRYEL